MEDSPYIRQIGSPIDAGAVRPLDPRCRVVQFSDPLAEHEHRAVADLLRQRPDVALRVYGHYKDGADLAFLRHYQTIRSFQVDVFELGDVDGLRYLPDDLEHLGIGATRSKRFSLSPLARFRELKSLRLDGQSKDLAVLSELGSLERLSLRSITLPDLSLLTPLNRLVCLWLRLGGTTDVGLLPSIGMLKYLEIWMVRGLSDLSSIADILTLRFLFLQAIKRVVDLPSFRSLECLQRVHLETMKGLTDLQPVADAPALKQLLAIDMKHLQPEAFRPFIGHPSLEQATIGLGSLKKNRAVERLLALPQAESPEELKATCESIGGLT